MISGPSSDISKKFRASFLANAKLGRYDANRLLASSMKEKKINLTFSDQLYVLESATKLPQHIGLNVLNNEMISHEIKIVGQSYITGFYTQHLIPSVQLMLETELDNAILDERLEDAERIIALGSNYMSRSHLVRANKKIEAELVRLEFEKDYPSTKTYIASAPLSPQRSAANHSSYFPKENERENNDATSPRKQVAPK